MSVTERRLRWKRFAQRPGTATGMEAVKRLSLHLCHLKVMPDAANDDDVARLKAHLVGQTRGEPDAEINSFIEGYNARTRGPKLTRLPTEADRREEAATTLCGPELLAEIQACVVASAASGPVGGLKAGIVRMIGLLVDQGPPIRTLDDLLTPWAIAAIGYSAPTTSRLERTRPVPPTGSVSGARGRVGVRGRRRAEAAAAAPVNSLAEPSQARLHYYGLLEKIALYRGNAEALARLAERRKASAHIDPTIPATSMSNLSIFDDVTRRDALLARLAQTLMILLRQPLAPSAHYRACGLIAVLVGFTAGRRPEDLVGLGCLTGEPLADGGRYLTDPATGEAKAWVPHEVAVLVEATQAWIAPHRLARPPTWLLENPEGKAFKAPALSYHMAKALEGVEAALRPKDLKDWTGIELLRAGVCIEHVSDYLRFATTEACAARFRLVQEAFEKRGHAHMIAERAGVANDD